MQMLALITSFFYQEVFVLFLVCLFQSRIVSCNKQTYKRKLLWKITKTDMKAIPYQQTFTHGSMYFHWKFVINSWAVRKLEITAIEMGNYIAFLLAGKG